MSINVLYVTVFFGLLSFKIQKCTGFYGFKLQKCTPDFGSFELSIKGQRQRNFSPTPMGVPGRPEGQNLEGCCSALWITCFVFL